ncbi:DUF2207 domain-containing protein [Parapedobacter tibetensis]|uniref:DUF2207 domain-containing protein n=1 Tax=Parapedobacter tibetensis TaxID=2972951 RepID=UPI00214D4005|nr:DUF2207 domain-containing protein [Parapedobacter tibetensis]
MLKHPIILFPLVLCAFFMCLFQGELSARQSSEEFRNDSLYWMTQEYIHAFDVDMKLDSSGMLLVTEQITIHALGRDFKRGLVRTIPTSRINKHGIRKRIDFEITDIRKDGAEEHFFTEETRNDRSIYIGKEHVMLTPGIHTYTITYQTKGHVGFFDGYDEIYWNVTGDKWNFTIRRASITLHLPKGASVLQHQCYTGPADRSTNACTYADNSDGTLHFQTQDNVNQWEGFAIAVGFTPGFIRRPGILEGFYNDYKSYVLAAILVFGLFLYYYFLWNRHGRDPKMPTIIAQYEPPDKLSPARMRYLYKRKVDDKTFTTALINMAVKKHITIAVPRTKKENYMLRKRSEEPDGLSKEEAEVFQKLFRSRKSISTAASNGTTLRSTKDVLKKTITNDIRIKDYFLKNTRQAIWGFLALLLALVVYFIVEARDTDFLLLFVTPFVAFGGVITVLGINEVFKGNFFIGLLLTGFGLIFGAVPLVSILATADQINYVLAFFMVACIGLYVLFVRLVKVPTEVGATTMSKILGFKMYLETVEEHRLNILNPPDHTPELFEKFLPYAFALDVENQWAEKFKNELEKLGYEPDWYTGDSMTTFNVATVGVLASFSGAVNPAPPSSSGSSSGSSGSSSWSSGSSGGGSSSGGGGGGGGGGW